ncbi:aminotransferase class V-fold PLP-dependent enzyme [Acetobacter sp. TBRC 12305]|uniref:Aminotransferase class V-fold PLP-dependent enzyme n=1 Tax=Acetobacter garciniae TaxID=2817435 RepID=A0A939HKN1_9PROT|nr:aminotransferase class V-fold PLP-dependent enzyme [Acetobacter garciniae]MBO1326165.1 aminotransferase class V-fold PLP-dependent enzyme [Acetobacter garciniae]MBX0345091.1 aminotransferase class V-fold PLP-dependent enzyme [Acetobacter garciniae]
METIGTLDDSTSILDRFGQALRSQGLAALAKGVIGDGAKFDTPFGTQSLLYADYVASGRALRQVETFVMDEILPYYANSHTEASFCGAYMTRLRSSARATIARLCNAPAEKFTTIFMGNGATAGLNRLVHLLEIPARCNAGQQPSVFIGPYEHHSNILPWRESGARIVEIPEAAGGGPDMAALEAALKSCPEHSLKVGSFSAASNVTGILTDVNAVTAMLKRHGALAIWDYAGAGPYCPIDMQPGTPFEKDAVVVSCHKFIGGPAASGVLIVRNAAVSRHSPVLPGGGTVRFVSPWTHDYSSCLASREESGTPNVIGDIRSALAFIVKDVIGDAYMAQRNAELRERALAAWRGNPAIEIIGHPTARALPIFSFRVRNLKEGGFIHQQLFTRMLSDHYGIQVRGGCACAGPYAHRLLGIDETESAHIRNTILSGQEIEKPGWTRLNFSVLMDDAKVQRILDAVNELASAPCEMAALYDCDVTTARFRPKAVA